MCQNKNINLIKKFLITILNQNTVFKFFFIKRTLPKKDNITITQTLHICHMISIIFVIVDVMIIIIVLLEKNIYNDFQGYMDTQRIRIPRKIFLIIFVGLFEVLYKK